MDFFKETLLIGCCGFYINIPFNCLDIALCAIVFNHMTRSDFFLLPQYSVLFYKEIYLP